MGGRPRSGSTIRLFQPGGLGADLHNYMRTPRLPITVLDGSVELIMPAQVGQARDSGSHVGGRWGRVDWSRAPPRGCLPGLPAPSLLHTAEDGPSKSKATKEIKRALQRKATLSRDIDCQGTYDATQQ